MPVNAATKYAIRTVLREAINKSNPEYKGNNNRKNCRYISLAAQQQLADDPTAPLVADHALPVSLSLREFEALRERSIDAAVALVAKYAIMVLVTRAEDTTLRAAGLVKCMPPDWDGQEGQRRMNDLDRRPERTRLARSGPCLPCGAPHTTGGWRRSCTTSRAHGLR
jgi:hypothetical protein